ncbi:MAG TPA: response regulator [Kofleriaceae bacterium]|nr:response regulator [Kofleriaceae bacterium]
MAPRPESPAAPRLRVLVVDDRALVGEQVARMLATHDVTRVDSAEAAVAAMKRAEQDAILYALALPGVSGFAFADLLAAQRPAMRRRLVLMLDHAPSRGVLGKVERTGVRWITKPLRYAPLVTAVSGSVQP